MNNHRIQTLFPITRITWKEFLAYPDEAQELYINHLVKNLKCSIQQMADVFKVSRFVLQNHCKVKRIPLGQVSKFKPSPNKDFQAFMKKEDLYTQKLRKRMALYDAIVKARKMGLTIRQTARVANCSANLAEQVLKIWKLANKENVEALRTRVHDKACGVVGAIRWACIRNGIDLRVLMVEPATAEVSATATVEVPVTATVEAPVTEPVKVPVAEPVLSEIEKEGKGVTVKEFQSVLKEFNGHMRFLRAFFAKAEPVPQA